MMGTCYGCPARVSVCSYMAQRHSSHQPSEERGALATGWGAERNIKIPLLPYERQLIDALGCTVEEYEGIESLINYGNRRHAYADILT